MVKVVDFMFRTFSHGLKNIQSNKRFLKALPWAATAAIFVCPPRPSVICIYVHTRESTWRAWGYILLWGIYMNYIRL